MAETLMRKLLVLCAQAVEAAAVRESGVECHLIVCGVGFKAATTAAAESIESARPDLVLSVGTCGALREGLQLGDVFSPGRILSVHGDFDLLRLQAPDAVLVSQDQVAVTVQQKAALRFRGGDIVDMEAGAIARVCEARNLPFACLKAVSDLAGEDLPLDFNLYRDGQGKFQTTRIALAGIFQLPALVRLNSQNKLAAQALGRTLRGALS
jgi:adenosylhomocysteine nucleosidase